MSEELYDIVCEKCNMVKIGTFRPTRPLTPQEIWYQTHTGYLCEVCAQPPIEEDDSEDDGA